MSNTDQLIWQSGRGSYHWKAAQKYLAIIGHTRSNCSAYNLFSSSRYVREELPFDNVGAIGELPIRVSSDVRSKTPRDDSVSPKVTQKLRVGVLPRQILFPEHGN